MLPGEDKTKEQLTSELAGLRQRVAELEVTETQRKRMEEKIQQQNKFLNNILESLTYPFYVIDVNDYTIKMANPVAKAGNLSENPTCYAVGHKSDKPCGSTGYLCPLEKVKKTKKPVVVTHTHYDEDGNAKHIEIHAYPIFDTEGNVVQMIECLLDITERKQAEEELRKTQDYLDSLLRYANAPIIVWDTEQRITIFNTAFERLAGYMAGEVMEQPLSLLFPETSRDESLTKISQTLSGEYWESVEIPILRKDGEIRIALWNSANIYDKESKAILATIAQGQDITERKQAEEELRESEERYRALLNLGGGVGEAIVMLQDTEQGDAIQTFVSNEWPRITGYSRKELLGMSFFDLLHPKHREAYLKRHKRRMSGEIIPGLFEMSLIRKDGTEVPIEVTSAYTTYQGKRANVAFVRDITERKQAEEEVRWLARFPSENPNPVLRMAKDGTILYANEASLPLMNVWRSQIGKPLPDYWHKLVLDVLSSNSSKIVEIECQGRILSVTFAHVRGTNQVNLYGLDITERKRAEEELNVRAQILDSATDSIFVRDLDGNFFYINETFCKLHGRTRDELLGMKLHDLVTPEYARLIELRNKKLLEKGEASFESAYLRKDKSVIPVEVHARTINWGDRRLFLSVARDITERKQAEEREKELQQELYLSSRLASIGELAAGVAHELNNPLTGIIGFSQRLLRKSTDTKVSQDLTRIHNEAQRAGKVVENLLTFARRREPKKEYSNVNNILRRALELRVYELKTSNIEVVTDLTPSLPKIMVDFYQIQEVFLNIILNAEQVMTEAKGGGKLTIKTQEAKGYIKISFTDDGPGIPAEQLVKVFDPFFTTRDEKGGTGLGLSVCHGIVTEHGGRIYAKSKVGKGATFFVELPLATKKIAKVKL